MADTTPDASETKPAEWMGAALFRKPDTTHEHFSTAWRQHGLLATPWFLSIGVEEYIQIHLPDQSASESSGVSSALDGFDGVALVKTIPGSLGGNPYYSNVIAPDEQRFLHEESGSNPVKRDPPARQTPEQNILELGKLARELGGVEYVVVTGGKATASPSKEIEDQWKKWSASA